MDYSLSCYNRERWRWWVHPLWYALLTNPEYQHRYYYTSKQDLYQSDMVRKGGSSRLATKRTALPAPLPPQHHLQQALVPQSAVQHVNHSGSGGTHAASNGVGSLNSGSKLDDDVHCPQCGIQFNTSNFRKVTESCGHSKCRHCFIASEDGCNQCTEQEAEATPPPAAKNQYGNGPLQVVAATAGPPSATAVATYPPITRRATRLSATKNRHANHVRPSSSPGSTSNESPSTGRQTSSVYSDSTDSDSCLRFPSENDSYHPTIDFDTMAELTAPTMDNNFPIMGICGFSDMSTDNKSYTTIVNEESEFSKSLMSLRNHLDPALPPNHAAKNNHDAPSSSNSTASTSNSFPLGTTSHGFVTRAQLKEMPKLAPVTASTSSSYSSSSPSSSSLPTLHSQQHSSGGKRRPSNRDSSEPSSSSKLLNNGGGSPDITQGVPRESPRNRISSAKATSSSPPPPPQTSRLGALLTRSSNRKEPEKNHSIPPPPPPPPLASTSVSTARTSSPKQDSSPGGSRKLRNCILAEVNNQGDKGDSGSSSSSAVMKTEGDGVEGEPDGNESDTAEQLEEEEEEDDDGDGDGNRADGGGDEEEGDGPVKKKKKRSPVVIHDHITILGGDPPMYQCNVCQKKFKTKAHIKYHEFCMVGDKPFKCEQCGQGFIAKSHYEYHLRTHTGERPYVCPKCGKGFNQRGKVTRHMRSHTGEKPFICQECNRGFANAQALRSHTLIHTGERPFACTYCSKRFTGMTNLKKHVITHTGERPFSCNHCGKSFGLKWTLDLHLRTHSSERPYACEQCSRAFSNSKDLRRHLIIHSGERPFKCWICGTAFRRKDNLDRHIKNTHNQPKDVAKRLANDAAAEYLKNNSSKDSLVNIPVSKVNSVVISSIINKNADLFCAIASSRARTGQGASSATTTSASSASSTKVSSSTSDSTLKSIAVSSSASSKATSSSSTSTTTTRTSSVQSATSSSSPSSRRRVIITAQLSPPTTRASRAKETEKQKEKRPVQVSLTKPGKGTPTTTAVVVPSKSKPAPVSTAQSTPSPKKSSKKKKKSKKSKHEKKRRHSQVAPPPPSPPIQVESTTIQEKEKTTVAAERNDMVLSALFSERRPTLALVTPYSPKVEESEREATPSPPRQHNTFQDEEDMEQEKEVDQDDDVKGQEAAVTQEEREVECILPHDVADLEEMESAADVESRLKELERESDAEAEMLVLQSDSSVEKKVEKGQLDDIVDPVDTESVNNRTVSPATEIAELCKDRDFTVTLVDDEQAKDHSELELEDTVYPPTSPISSTPSDHYDPSGDLDEDERATAQESPPGAMDVDDEEGAWNDVAVDDEPFQESEGHEVEEALEEESLPSRQKEADTLDPVCDDEVIHPTVQEIAGEKEMKKEQEIVNAEVEPVEKCAVEVEGKRDDTKDATEDEKQEVEEVAEEINEDESKEIAHSSPPYSPPLADIRTSPQPASEPQSPETIESSSCAQVMPCPPTTSPPSPLAPAVVAVNLGENEKPESLPPDISDFVEDEPTHEGEGDEIEHSLDENLPSRPEDAATLESVCDDVITEEPKTDDEKEKDEIDALNEESMPASLESLALASKSSPSPRNSPVAEVDTLKDVSEDDPATDLLHISNHREDFTQSIVDKEMALENASEKDSDSDSIAEAVRDAVDCLENQVEASEQADAVQIPHDSTKILVEEEVGQSSSTVPEDDGVPKEKEGQDELEPGEIVSPPTSPISSTPSDHSVDMADVEEEEEENFDMQTSPDKMDVDEELDEDDNEEVATISTTPIVNGVGAGQVEDESKLALMMDTCVDDHTDLITLPLEIPPSETEVAVESESEGDSDSINEAVRDTVACLEDQVDEVKEMEGAPSEVKEMEEAPSEVKEMEEAPSGVKEMEETPIVVKQLEDTADEEKKVEETVEEQDDQESKEITHSSPPYSPPLVDPPTSPQPASEPQSPVACLEDQVEAQEDDEVSAHSPLVEREQTPERKTEICEEVKSSVRDSQSLRRTGRLVERMDESEGEEDDDEDRLYVDESYVTPSVESVERERETDEVEGKLTSKQVVSTSPEPTCEDILIEEKEVARKEETTKEQESVDEEMEQAEKCTVEIEGRQDDTEDDVDDEMQVEQAIDKENLVEDSADEEKQVADIADEEKQVADIADEEKQVEETVEDEVEEESKEIVHSSTRFSPPLVTASSPQPTSEPQSPETIESSSSCAQVMPCPPTPSPPPPLAPAAVAVNLGENEKPESLPPDISDFVLSVLEKKSKDATPDDLESISSESLPSPPSDMENSIKQCIQTLESDCEDEQQHDVSNTRAKTMSPSLRQAVSASQLGQKGPWNMFGISYESPRTTGVAMSVVNSSPKSVITTTTATSTSSSSLPVSSASQSHITAKIPLSIFGIPCESPRTTSKHPTTTLASSALSTSQKVTATATTTIVASSTLQISSPHLPPKVPSDISDVPREPKCITPATSTMNSAPKPVITTAAPTAVSSSHVSASSHLPPKVESRFTISEKLPRATAALMTAAVSTSTKPTSTVASSPVKTFTPVLDRQPCLQLVSPISKLEIRVPVEMAVPAATQLPQSSHIPPPPAMMFEAATSPIKVSPPAPLEKVPSPTNKSVQPVAQRESPPMVPQEQIPEVIPQPPPPPPPPQQISPGVTRAPSTSSCAVVTTVQPVNGSILYNFNSAEKQYQSPAATGMPDYVPTQVQFMLPEGYPVPTTMQEQHYVSLPTVTSTQSQQLTYDPSSLYFIQSDGQQALEGNYQLVYAVATARAEPNDGAEDGPPTKVRLVHAEALGIGQNSNELQFYYASTTPDQHVQPTNPQVQLIEPVRVMYNQETNEATSEMLRYQVQPSQPSPQVLNLSTQQQQYQLPNAQTYYQRTIAGHVEEQNGRSPSQNTESMGNVTIAAATQESYVGVCGPQDLSGRYLEHRVQVKSNQSSVVASVYSDDPERHAWMDKARDVGHMFPQGALQYSNNIFREQRSTACRSIPSSTVASSNMTYTNGRPQSHSSSHVNHSSSSGGDVGNGKPMSGLDLLTGLASERLTAMQYEALCTERAAFAIAQVGEMARRKRLEQPAPHNHHIQQPQQLVQQQVAPDRIQPPFPQQHVPRRMGESTTTQHSVLARQVVHRQAVRSELHYQQNQPHQILPHHLAQQAATVAAMHPSTSPAEQQIRRGPRKYYLSRSTNFQD